MSIIQSLYGEEHEYKVNGATYIVSAAFKHTGRKEDNTSFQTEMFGSSPLTTISTATKVKVKLRRSKMC